MFYVHDRVQYLGYFCFAECKSFVLKLWKFLHTAALQRQHTILDSAVEDLAPLPTSAISFLEEEEGEGGVAGGKMTDPDSFADKIQVCQKRDRYYCNVYMLSLCLVYCDL